MKIEINLIIRNSPDGNNNGTKRVNVPQLSHLYLHVVDVVTDHRRHNSHHMACVAHTGVHFP